MHALNSYLPHDVKANTQIEIMLGQDLNYSLNDIVDAGFEQYLVDYLDYVQRTVGENSLCVFLKCIVQQIVF